MHSIAFSRGSTIVPSFISKEVEKDRIIWLGDTLRLESGILKDESSDITLVLESILTQFNPTAAKVKRERDSLVKSLRATLKSHHSLRGERQRRCFVLLPNTNIDPKIKSTLAELVPELGWIKLSKDGNESVFVMDNYDLAVAIQLFLGNWDNKRNKESK